MFLNLLNQNEGENFLELAEIAMKVNGVKKESERSVVQTYKNEMSLENYNITGKKYDNIIKLFKSSEKRKKRAIIIELAGVLDADGEIDKGEHDWIIDLGTDLNFRDSEIRKMVRWVEDFNDLLEEGYRYINGR